MRARVLVLLLALLGVALVPAGATAAPGDITITAPGTSGDDDTPLLEGTVVPTAEVRISLDGTLVTTLPPQPSGTWSYQVGTPVQGSTLVYVEAVVGGLVVDDDLLSYSVRPPVQTLTITTPAPGATVGPWTDVEGTTSVGAPLDVELFLDGTSLGPFDGYTDLTAGTWVAMSLDLGAFPSGPHELTARATDGFGRELESAPVLLTLDTDPPAVPVVTSPAAGSVVDDERPTFTGTGDPGATVTVIDYYSGEPFAEGFVSGDGSWTATTTEGAFALLRGQRTELLLLVRSSDAVGNVSFSDELPIVLDLRAGPPPAAGPGQPAQGGGAVPGTAPRPPAAAPTRGELAATGPSALLHLGALAASLLLAGTSLTRLARRS